MLHLNWGIGVDALVDLGSPTPDEGQHHLLVAVQIMQGAAKGRSFASYSLSLPACHNNNLPCCCHCWPPHWHQNLRLPSLRVTWESVALREPSMSAMQDWDCWGSQLSGFQPLGVRQLLLLIWLYSIRVCNKFTEMLEMGLGVTKKESITHSEVSGVNEVYSWSRGCAGKSEHSHRNCAWFLF